MWLQRYGQSSLFKRTVLDLIAEDLLALPQTEDSGECRVDEDMKPVRPVFYIVTGEPFKQSEELTGEPIKMKG